jgi:hypothetical protein
MVVGADGEQRRRQAVQVGIEREMSGSRRPSTDRPGVNSSAKYSICSAVRRSGRAGTPRWLGVPLRS